MDRGLVELSLPLVLMEVMDHETRESRRSGSFGRTSSAGSSSRLSLRLSGAHLHRKDDGIETESVSEAGDIGDRALSSNRFRESGRLSFSLDGAVDSGVVVPIPEDSYVQSHGFQSGSATGSIPFIAALSTNVTVQSALGKQDDKNDFPWWLDYISCLIHLAVFGILGVFTRYLLEKLFGPGAAGVTSNGSILYLDLPSNMMGSFLMGWLGVVFKGDISTISDHLAIGLSTGYLGSLTTFSGWNQKMLDLSVNGQWVSSVLGFLIGLFLASHSIIFGVETAKGFRWLLKRLNTSSRKSFITTWRVNSYRRHLTVMVFMMLMLGFLWCLSAIMEKREFENAGSEAQLWLGFLVAAPGVWIRWFLARFNGHGLGETGTLKWLPFGTLIANVAAACIMAALSTVKKAVNTKTSDTIASGLQLGFLGCLSTVSTFIAEFNAMRQSKHPWRAYAYAMITIILSFGLGILIYSVPVWVKGYN